MTHHDLVILGAGSGNTVVDACTDLDVAVVDHGEFGGTCLNAGCIPTKMLTHTADVAEAVRAAGRFGVDARLDAVRWTEVQDRVFGRLDAVAADGRAGRVDAEHVTVHSGHARFTGPRTLSVERTDGSGHDVVSGDRVVVAAGSRPAVPEPVASSRVPFETSDTIMRRAALPRRLAILGGGYIAAEFAHVFSALGADIVMIDMADRLLGGQDEAVVDGFTALARERYDVRLGRQVESVTGTAGAVRLVLDEGPSRPTRCWSRSAARPTATASTCTRPGSSGTPTGASWSTRASAPPPRASTPWAT